MGFWDSLFGGGNSSSNRSTSSWHRSSSSDYDSRGHYNPGAWREKYDRENWEYHKRACDHDDPWDCNDDEHF